MLLTTNQKCAAVDGMKIDNLSRYDCQRMEEKNFSATNGNGETAKYSAKVERFLTIADNKGVHPRPVTRRLSVIHYLIATEIIFE